MIIRWQSNSWRPGLPGQIIAADGRSWLAQLDWDYPGIAYAFGWNIGDVQCDDQTCHHRGTDGTVDCDCGVTVDEFITAAADWLADHDGVTADDPGYFAEVATC